jgi:ankyrin repeat protein
VVDANVRDGQGHTPLMLAVGQGNMACAEVLLATGQV